MNNGGKAFRSALGGYNRDDVNEYIKSADLRHAAELDELKKSLEEAKTECAGYAASVQTAIAERDGARERAHADMIAAAELTKAKDGEIADLTRRFNLLKAESEAQTNVISSLRDEKSALSAETAELKAAADLLKKETEERIKAVSAEYAEKIAVLEAGQNSVRGLQAENEALTGTLNDAVNEASALRKNADSLSTRIAELEAQLSAALEESAKKNEELNAKNEEIAALTAAHEEALSRCVKNALGDVSDRGSDAYKLEMYDKVSSQLGDILIGANRNADEIITAAKSDAEKLRADTEIECEQKRAECDASVSRTRMEVEEEAAYIRERLSAAAGDLLSGVSTDLHANTENCIRELTACVEDMQYEIRALFSRLTSRCTEMNDRIDYYQTCVSEGVGARLSGMDEKYGIPALTLSADGDSHDGK